MKVLHIFNSLMPSGAETMWAAAKDLLQREGVETHVVATLPDLGPYAERMRECGFVVHHIPHTARHLVDLSYSYRMISFLRHERFDAVQIHPEAWRLTNVLLARLAGVRCVTTTIHSVFAATGLRRIQRVLRMLFIRMLGGHIVAIGASVRDCERRYGYVPKLIWNWIDMIRFAENESKNEISATRSEWGLPLGAKAVIVVGNCAVVKNHAFLFRMAKHLPPNYYIIHVGREDPALGEREMVAGLGLTDRVRFLGARDDVPRLLTAADVFVMCSQKEGLGISCLEAMVKSIPSVVSDVPGLRDMSDIPLCAVVPLDEKAFASKVVEASELSTEERRKLAKMSHELIEKRFSLDRNVRDYLALWRCEPRKGDVG